MNEADAQAILQRVLDPLSADVFLDEILGKRFVKVEGGAGLLRRRLLGPDPHATILAAFDPLAPRITRHAQKPLGPPPEPAPAEFSADIAREIKGTHYDFGISDSGQLIFSVRDEALGWLSFRFGARLLERMLRVVNSAKKPAA